MIIFQLSNLFLLFGTQYSKMINYNQDQISQLLLLPIHKLFENIKVTAGTPIKSQILLPTDG